jgi:hypothetical protein
MTGLKARKCKMNIAISVYPVKELNLAPKDSRREIKKVS